MTKVKDNKGGRPKLADYQKRTKLVRIMFCENDFIYIQSKASKAGLSVSEYCHQAAMDNHIRETISPELAKGNQRLRDQLLIDNLRMENAALNLKEKELERFYSFCANAFYQIENVVNFYFYVMFPNIDNLLSFIENATNVDGKYSFKRNANKEYKSVSDIEITYKLNAICTTLFPDDKNIKITYSQLRQVRNEGTHRCMVIVKEHDESNALYRFFKYNTFNSIRIVLIKLVGTIKQEIENVGKIIKKRGVIVNVLPSIAFIKVEGKSLQVSLQQLKNVCNKTANSQIEIIYKNSSIIDIVDIK